jgi:hypothetical protein
LWERLSIPLLPHLVVGEGRVRVRIRFKKIISLRQLGSS